MGVEHLISDLILEHFKEPYNKIHKNFYESVPISVDVYWLGDDIQVKADLPGFPTDKIKARLVKNVLHIEAERDAIEDVIEKEQKENNSKQKYHVIYEHRPLKSRRLILLPFDPSDEKCKNVKLKEGAVYKDGVFTLNVTNLPPRSEITPKSN